MRGFFWQRLAFIGWLGSALLAAGTAVAGAADLQVRQITLGTDASGSVLTLALNGPVSEHLMHLHRPERLVIDLPQVHRRAALPAAAGLISAVRSGAQPQGLRLVLELSAPVHVSVTHTRVAAGSQLRLHLATLSAARVPLSAAASSAPASDDSPAPAAQAHEDQPVRAPHAPQGQRDIIVAVDAGHGGDDPGATGRSGTHEKNITLAIARALAARINQQSGMHAVLTRDGDYFVALRDRMQRARAAHADMFVSIHADAVRDRDVSGASVYILSERGASSEAARTLAAQENAADLKGGISLANQSPNLRSVLLDLSQSASIGESVEAAGRVLGALDRVGAVRKREVQQAAFVVLKSPDIPSMLVETAYISNPLEEQRLATPVQQQRLADAIFGGIDSYFRQYPPEGSLYARLRDDGGSIEVARSGQ